MIVTFRELIWELNKMSEVKSVTVEEGTEFVFEGEKFVVTVMHEGWVIACVNGDGDFEQIFDPMQIVRAIQQNAYIQEVIPTE